MGKKHTLEISHGQLYEDDATLIENGVPAQMIDRIKRIRTIATTLTSHPLTSDKDMRDTLIRKFGIVSSTAYDDIRLAKTIVGNMHEASKAYHRYVFNSMILDTHKKAKAAGNHMAMAMAADKYAKYNQLDKEDGLEYPFEDIVPQIWIPSSDPTILGIKPIPNIQQAIAKAKKKYEAEIEYVNWTEVGIDPDLLEYAQQYTDADE